MEVLRALSNPARLQMLGWLKNPREHFPYDAGVAEPDETGVCVRYLRTNYRLAQSTVSMRTSIAVLSLGVSTRPSTRPAPHC